MIITKIKTVFDSTLLLGIFCIIASGIVLIYGINDFVLDFDTLSLDMTFQPPMVFLSLIIFFLGVFFIIKTDFGFSP